MLWYFFCKKKDLAGRLLFLVSKVVVKLSVSHLTFLGSPSKNLFVDCDFYSCPWFTDFDECQLQGACPNGNCLNTVGSYRCMCKPGYVPDPTLTTCICKIYTPTFSITLSHCLSSPSHSRTSHSAVRLSRNILLTEMNVLHMHDYLLNADFQEKTTTNLWVWFFPSPYDRGYGKFEFHYNTLHLLQSTSKRAKAARTAAEAKVCLMIYIWMHCMDKKHGVYCLIAFRLKHVMQGRTYWPNIILRRERKRGSNPWSVLNMIDQLSLLLFSLCVDRLWVCISLVLQCTVNVFVCIL